MKLKEIKDILGAETLGECEEGELDMKYGYGADLMSDVLAFITDDCLLLSGLVNEQVIRTAEMVDVKGIVFVRNKLPTKETIRLADEKKITLLSTNMTMFKACGELYKAGLEGYSIPKNEVRKADAG